MRKILAIGFWFVMLLAMPMVVWGQGENVDMAFYQDLKNTFVAIILGLTVVFSIFAGGLLGLLAYISRHPTLMRALESGYDNARKDTKELVNVLHVLLQFLERQGKTYAPNLEITRQIDTAEDILEEITDGEPYQLTPAQAADILYRPTPSPLDNIQKGDDPETDKS